VSEGKRIPIDLLLDALEELVEEKRPISMAPIEELRREIESSATSDISVSKIIHYLVEAGYNINDIKRFMIRSGIVDSMEEWIAVKHDVERAVLMERMRRELGG